MATATPPLTHIQTATATMTATTDELTPIAIAKSVTLPLTFSNSFWSPDYRTGFEKLYNQLEAAIVQSGEIVDVIRMRSELERSLGEGLIPVGLKRDGFGIDEGASLKMGLESLLSSFVLSSRSHLALSESILRTILIPFEEWSEGHKGRIRSSRSLIEGHLATYEKRLTEVQKAKSAYDEACRLADSVEDELSFSQAHPPHEKQKEQEAEPTSAAQSESGEMDEEDPNMISRSGATGGSLTAALGRAFSTRRPPRPTATSSPSSSPEHFPLPDPSLALDWSKQTLLSLRSRLAPSSLSPSSRLCLTRQTADTSETRYASSVSAVESARLVLEESLMEHYAYVMRCELDRVRAAGSAMRALWSAVGEGATGTGEKVKSALGLIRPERDVLAIIERLRTGPFQPRPISYHSHYSEPSTTTFGIDLRKFDETNAKRDEEGGLGMVPPVLRYLLEVIKERYEGLDDTEKRKAWLYETPLASQHRLRALLNPTPLNEFPSLKAFDLPLLASVVKLWLLELEVPVILFSHYEEYKALYPLRVGSEGVETPRKLVASHVARGPPVHLEVLRLLISHFSSLLSNTSTEEPTDVYLQKLSLSFARCIIRPKHETPLTLDDKFPSLLFIDLVRGYEEVFRDADELKTRQREDRYKPRRQRTKPIDQRPSRSRMGVGESVSLTPKEADQILKGQPQPQPTLTIPSTTETGGEAVTGAPMATSPMAETPKEELPPVPSAAGGEEKGKGKERERERRGARGPRPLPGSEATISPPPVKMPKEEVNLEKEATAPPADEEDD